MFWEGWPLTNDFPQLGQVHVVTENIIVRVDAGIQVDRC